MSKDIITFGRGAGCECCPPWVRDNEADIDYSPGEAREIGRLLIAAADRAEGLTSSSANR